MKVVYHTEYGSFSISKECAEWMADRGNVECAQMLERGEFYGYLHDTPRHDILLNMAVEALGITQCGENLAVHELKGDRYYIDEYDGHESIVEPHNIEWVVV